MKLITEKSYQDLKKYFDMKLEEQEEYYNQVRLNDKSFINDLLIRCNEQENKIGSLESKIDKLTEENKKLKNHDDERETIYERLIGECDELKATLKVLRGSLGGSKKEINKLRELVGYQNQYIDWLKGNLSKHQKKVPTMNELLKYEHTHKSPRKEEKNVQVSDV